MIWRFRCVTKECHKLQSADCSNFFVAALGDDPKSDAIAATMDLIWSGSWAKGQGLFAAELTKDQINAHRKKVYHFVYEQAAALA